MCGGRPMRSFCSIQISDHCVGHQKLIQDESCGLVRLRVCTLWLGFEWRLNGGVGSPDNLSKQAGLPLITILEQTEWQVFWGTWVIISRAVSCSWRQAYRVRTSFPRCMKASARRDVWGEKGTCYWRGRRLGKAWSRSEASRWKSALSGHCRYSSDSVLAKARLDIGVAGKETEGRRARGTEKQRQDSTDQPSGSHPHDPRCGMGGVNKITQRQNPSNPGAQKGGLRVPHLYTPKGKITVLVDSLTAQHISCSRRVLSTRFRYGMQWVHHCLCPCLQQDFKNRQIPVLFESHVSDQIILLLSRETQFLIYEMGMEVLRLILRIPSNAGLITTACISGVLKLSVMVPKETAHARKVSSEACQVIVFARQQEPLIFTIQSLK